MDANPAARQDDHRVGEDQDGPSPRPTQGDPRGADPGRPDTTFGTVGKPLTILAALAMLIIMLLVLRRKMARRKRAARAKAR